MKKNEKCQDPSGVGDFFGSHCRYIYVWWNSSPFCSVMFSNNDFAVYCFMLTLQGRQAHGARRWCSATQDRVYTWHDGYGLSTGSSETSAVAWTLFLWCMELGWGLVLSLSGDWTLKIHYTPCSHQLAVETTQAIGCIIKVKVIFDLEVICYIY